MKTSYASVTNSAAFRRSTPALRAAYIEAANAETDLDDNDLCPADVAWEAIVAADVPSPAPVATPLRWDVPSPAPVATPLRWDVHEALFEKAVAALRKERREATKARCQAEDRRDGGGDLATLNRAEAVALAKASIGQHLEHLISLHEIAHVDAVECILSLTKI